MVEPGLKNISHGREKCERPNMGLPAALSGNRLPKATKGRGQPSAALSLGSVYLCTAKSPGGGCSLGPGAQHQPAFQRHRRALAFLTAQCDPDIRAAGKWDFARIEFGKNHFRKKKTKKPKQPSEHSLEQRSIQLVPTQARADTSQGIISITELARERDRELSLAPATGIPTCFCCQMCRPITAVLFMPSHGC